MKTILITGAAKRIGKTIAEKFHIENYNIIIHYQKSKNEAYDLANNFNYIRKNSAYTINFDFNKPENINNFVKKINQYCDNLDVLVNNASNFYPTPIDNIDINNWYDLINTNITTPFLLSTKLSSILKNSIINIIDIHAFRPLKNHSIYCIAKSAVDMMTKSLAKELAPNIRVNSVSPGSILWQEKSTLSKEDKNQILEKIALKKQGKAKDIAQAVYFLTQANYITGQNIIIDGGRMLNQ